MTKAKAIRPAVSLAVLLGLLVVASACSHNPPPTKVAGVADIATRIEMSVTVVLHEAVIANATIVNGKPLVSRDALDTVAIAGSGIGRAGLALTAALNDYNTAKAAGKDTTKYAAIVQQILADINGVLVQISHAIPNGVVASIDNAVTVVLSLLTQVKAGL
jgi:hypothetical protein